MNGARPLRCQKCGKTIGYVSLTEKSSLETRPDLDNVKVIGTCVDCQGGMGIYRRNY